MISILIPVKDGGADFVRCLEGIARQQVDDDIEVVVVDSGSTDGTPARARALGAQVHEIPADEFDHGETRNLLARLSHGDVLVYTVHDAVAANERWLATLVAALDGDGVAGAYSRQIPHAYATPLEQFFLDFLYGRTPREQRLNSVDQLTFERTLFSNVSSAISRHIWEAHPFHPAVLSEDQEWSRRVLLAGYTIVYEPRSVVHHSHSYSLPAAFHRFYLSGVSSERSYMAGRASRSALRRAMVRYAWRELSWLWATGQRRWIPYAIVYELTKALGLQLGRRSSARRRRSMRGPIDDSIR